MTRAITKDNLSVMSIDDSSIGAPVATEPGAWMLVGIASASGDAEIIVVHPTPFTIGRKPGCSLQVNNRTVSSLHAILEIHGTELIITDQGSTNGTYVNGKRITESIKLHEDDLLQIAEVPFRLRYDSRVSMANTLAEDVCDKAMALVQFDRLIENRLVTPFFQPIININTAKVLGYEILARSRLYGLESSYAMFSAAARMNMEVELSQMLRWEGIREGLAMPQPSLLFVNTHPLEIQKPGLMDSLVQVRQLSADVPIVLEVHEAAMTDPAEMRLMKNQLKDLNIGLAYDDFGAGQTRLGELVEAPPDYLKFDMSLIRNLDKASVERQRMLGSLVKLVLDLGIAPLAEGIETREEAEVCRQLGFTTAQGYYFGRPAPPSQALQ